MTSSQLGHVPPHAAAPSYNFQLLFNNALKAYEKRTKNDLLAHPLAAQLQTCNSPATILAVLHQQIEHNLDQSRTADEKWTRWLDPTVNVLYTLSGTLGEGVGLIFSPAKVIFAGIGVLLLTAKDVREGQDTLVDIFERVENFFRRLETYTEVPMTADMMDITIKIMVEVLGILGIATKEIKQGRTKKYVKKLVGRRDLEDALKRLDKLTHEEVRMVMAQVLKATHTVEERVRGVADTLLGVDDRVTRVEDGVTSVDERVAGVDGRLAGIDNRVKDVNDKADSIDQRVKAIDDKVDEVTEDAKQGRVVTQQTATDVDQVKRNQLLENIHRWLSPSDPSANHNIACGTHHKRTATWFFEGTIFKEWVSSGSLLWIYGKPGSGKSVLCSTIIQDIEAMCEPGQASICYFYFDFRNINKQHLNDLIPSLITQLSTHSEPLFDILLRLYATHDGGRKQPSDVVLAECLKEMLILQDQPPIYLIIDALDESPDTSGIPSPRERVLQLLRELIELQLSNLHICVTSRPEIDIKHVIEPLTSLRVSLHDQTGQKKDIEAFVRSIVHSDSEPIMRRWRTEDKEHVIETLSKRADGMFRWVFCQLETLRHFLPASVRRTLDELPESLDETYERMLKEIKRPNRDHARRLLQCLVVAIRPLRIEELAEVLAVDFDDGESVPNLNPDWRWEDQEQALLSSCSSLISIVDIEESHVVQFSHFSVKEFLTSPRLATSSRDVSWYHVSLEDAHVILAQACLGVLLWSGDRAGCSPLAGYAAQYWVIHAQFENVSAQVQTAMECLFDHGQPHFAMWVELYDIDTFPPSGSTFYIFYAIEKSGATPLYYAALCGFHDLADHLIVKNLQDVNAQGGFYFRPFVAALAGRHFETAELLHRNGADSNVQGQQYMRTPLHSAAYYGDLEMVQKLIEYGADIDARDEPGRTPLCLLSEGIHLKDPGVVQLLLDHGADLNARANAGSTPLHMAASWGAIDVARMLLEHGADVEAKDNHDTTPLYCGRARQHNDIDMTKLLLEYGAK